jgi:hypothetical protein
LTAGFSCGKLENIRGDLWFVGALQRFSHPVDAARDPIVHPFGSGEAYPHLFRLASIILKLHRKNIATLPESKVWVGFVFFVKVWVKVWGFSGGVIV